MIPCRETIKWSDRLPSPRRAGLLTLRLQFWDMVFFRILLTALLTAAAISSVLAAPVLQREEPTITVIPGQAPTSLSTEVLDRETTTISGTPTHAPTPVLNVVLARGMDIW
ncbi:MAG: hypothetical protein NXY57DRAFT_357157 [Lentinula lateritia]|nr:MAG: hypothetical protein NXY57DRAFT_357157 [Lentinula lateritia]